MENILDQLKWVAHLPLRCVIYPAANAPDLNSCPLRGDPRFKAVKDVREAIAAVSTIAWGAHGGPSPVISGRREQLISPVMRKWSRWTSRARRWDVNQRARQRGGGGQEKQGETILSTTAETSTKQVERPRPFPPPQKEMLEKQFGKARASSKGEKGGREGSSTQP